MWKPKINLSENMPTPIYMQLIGALERDIASGQLASGASLPPHRKLADMLGISPGTITRAYREAEVRGLIEGHVGQGTRVRQKAGSALSIARPVSGNASSQGWSELRSRSSSMLNLTLNEPPFVNSLSSLASVFSELGNDPGGWLDFCRYGPAIGFEKHREVLADWIGRKGISANPYRMALCKGAQHALNLVLSACTNRGDGILVENHTYSGIGTAAEAAGLHLIAVEMDDEGMVPESLRKVARHHNSKIVYLIPTLQNPTTAVMSLERRQQIIEVAKDADLIIIEDDVYGALVDETLPTLHKLAPDICFYITSLSKTVCPALRTGIILAPNDRFFSRINRGLQANVLTSSSFDTLVATRLIKSGGADTIVNEVREESTRRVEAARAILGSDMNIKSVRGGFHIWLPMRAKKLEEVVTSALQEGIAISPSSPGDMPEDGMSGLRLCLGAPVFEDLVSGLNTLRPLLLYRSGTNIF